MENTEWGNGRNFILKAKRANVYFTAASQSLGGDRGWEWNNLSQRFSFISFLRGKKISKQTLVCPCKVV
jgi:hypothetical protein